MALLPTLITRLVGWSARYFYTLETLGEPVPGGAVLVVANHPNALLDPIIVFRAARRVVRPLAKEPLFHHPLIGPVLRSLGGLPVYRRQDHPDRMHDNEQTFAAAISALRAGDAVQIFPEGQSHSEPKLTPLKTGSARIALRAEAESGWQLGLEITPIGLTYARKTFFRGRAVALVGPSFDIAGMRSRYESDPAAAVAALTAEITRRLEELTLNLAQREDLALIDTADRLYAREKGIVDWREQEALGQRIPRLQSFARGLAWLRTHDPARHHRLARTVRRYQRLAELLGAGEADVPPRYGRLGAVWYVVRELATLVVGLPLALLALPFWYPPYALNRAIVNRLKVDETGVATYKLGLAIVLMPLAWIGWTAAALLVRGAAGAAITLIGLPMLALILYAWSGRWEKVRQDLRLFARVAGNPRSRDRLVEQRRELVREFDAVIAAMREPTRPA